MLCIFGKYLIDLLLYGPFKAQKGAETEVVDWVIME